MDPLNRRLFFDSVFKWVFGFFSMLVFIPLAFILFYIVKNGISVLSWSFLTSLPKPIGEIGGGVSNAILGSVIVIGIACIAAVPIGLLVGIFLYEQKQTRYANILRTGIEVLQSVPSIVIGLVVYLWVVVPLGGFSAFSGGLALGLMMLPVIIRSTEETLKLIPDSLKEASLGLGVPYYRTIIKVVLPTGLNGILTGIVLGVARISGETAPLIFTAFGNAFMNLNPLKETNALPLMIYHYATSPYPEWQQLAWGASFLLIVFIFSISILAKVVTRRHG